MGSTTAIAWTDHTFNPWWGCEKVSPGCDNCYAEAFSRRVGQDVWGKHASRRFFGEKHWREPLRWSGRVFCASMADVFEPNPDVIETRRRLFDLIESTPYLTWQLLTKRPEQVERLAPERWMGRGWPVHVWLGTTVEDNQRAALRIPRLLNVPAEIPVRFLSCEPLLERTFIYPWLNRGRIGWVICGGESGPHHRPLELDWARDLRDQCRSFDVPFFFKQVGGRTPTAGGDLLDGVQHKRFPLPAGDGLSRSALTDGRERAHNLPVVAERSGQ